MIRIILASLFLYSTSFAGLPPTTVKGMSEAGKTTTFNVVTPNNQATTTGAATRLIETGNGNRLKNPNFLAASSTTDWVIGSGVTTVDDNTFYFTPNKSLQLTLPSGTQTNLDILSQTFTSDGGDLSGSNLEVSIRLAKSIYQAGIDLKLCLDINSVQKNCVAVPQTTGNTYFTQYLFNYPAANTTATTTYRVYLRANYTGISGSAAIISVQDAYLGPARNIGSGVPNNVFSAKVSSAGVVTDENEDFINGNITPSGTSFPITFTTGKFNIAPTCTLELSDSITAVGAGTRIASVSSTGITVTSYDSNGTTPKAFTIICTRASSDFIQPAITPNQWNTNLTSAGPITIGATTTAPTKGTTSVDRVLFAHKGDLGVFHYEYRQTVAGSAGSGDYLFSLPNNLKFDTSKITLGTTISGWNAISYDVSRLGVATFTQGSTPAIGYIIPYSTTQFRVYVQNTAGSGGMISSGMGLSANANVVFSFDFTAPIAGWTENQNAPQLLGSLTSDDISSALRFEYGTIAASGAVTTACSTTPCTMWNYSPNMNTAPTRSAAGTYGITFSKAWSTWHKCFINSEEATPAGAIAGRYVPTNSTTGTVYVGGISNGVDKTADFYCFGPR